VTGSGRAGGALFALEDLERAERLVHAVLPPTPQRRWPLLAERLGTDVVVKHENHQVTGAFKARGGLVYVDRMKRERPHVAGLVSATRGNHGQSIAYAGRRHGVPVTIFVPRGNSVEKNRAMRAFGADLIEAGDDFDAARGAAKSFAVDNAHEMVPSFHRDLVLGVATYALELMTAEPDLDVLYVPVGLGSGICGALSVRDLLGRKTEIVGVQASAAPAYALSLAAGRVVTTPSADTRADGIATRVPDEQALACIRRGVSRIVQVSDDEIAEAIRIYWTDTHNLAEGAGAAPLAAALKERDRLGDKRVGLVLSGGNIDLALFAEWVMGHRLPAEPAARRDTAAFDERDTAVA
jgi:threonine dehydratase